MFVCLFERIYESSNFSISKVSVIQSQAVISCQFQLFHFQGSVIQNLAVVSVFVFVCLVGFLTSSSTTRLYRGRAPRQERLTILRAATHETELGDHDFCLSRSHYTDTDPTCRERAATAGIKPGTSSPGVARSTAELPRPPCQCQFPRSWSSKDLASLRIGLVR